MSEKMGTDDSAKANCCVCGSSKIGGICHHCDGYICENHFPKDESFILTKKVNEYGEIPGFCDASAGEPDPAHCPDHKHYTRTYYWLFLIAGFLLLSVSLKQPPFPLFFEKLVVWIASAVIAALLIFKIYEWNKRRRSDTKVPLLPAWAFKIEESITHDFNIGGETYSEWKNATGKFTVEPLFTDADKERYDSFIKTYVPFKQREFDTGSIIMKNLHRTSLRSEDGFKWSHLRLTYRAKNYEELMKQNTKKEYDYEITDLDKGKKKYTFWLFPHLTEGSAGSNLEIHLVFPKFSDIKSKIQIKKLEINIPKELYKATNLRVASESIGKIDYVKNVVVWTDIPIKSKDTIFELEFSEPVTEVSKLQGNYELTIKGEDASFSSIMIIPPVFPPALLEPGSQPGEIRSNDSSTKIQGAFIIDTAIFMNEESYTKSKKISKIHYYPDHRLIDLIIKVLADSKVHIKRLTETSARPSSGHGYTKNHFWTIFGRVYHDFYPIDVHLILSGREVYKMQTQPIAGESEIEFTVRARTTKRDMQRLVHVIFDRISNQLHQMLQLLMKQRKLFHSPDKAPATRERKVSLEHELDSLIDPMFEAGELFPEDIEKMPSRFDALFKSAVKELRARISRLPDDLQVDAHKKLSTAIDAYRQSIISSNTLSQFLDEFDAELTPDYEGD